MCVHVYIGVCYHWMQLTHFTDKTSHLTHSLPQIISETAQSYVKQSRPCLEPCLRKLAKTLESFVVSANYNVFTRRHTYSWTLTSELCCSPSESSPASKQAARLWHFWTLERWAYPISQNKWCQILCKRYNIVSFPYSPLVWIWGINHVWNCRPLTNDTTYSHSHTSHWYGYDPSIMYRIMSRTSLEMVER